MSKVLRLHSVKISEQKCPQNRTNVKNDGYGEPLEPSAQDRTVGVTRATSFDRFCLSGKPGRASSSQLGCASTDKAATGRDRPRLPATTSAQPDANQHMAAAQETAHGDQDTAICSHKQANKQNPTRDVSNRAYLHAQPLGASLEPQRPRRVSWVPQADQRGGGGGVGGGVAPRRSLLGTLRKQLVPRFRLSPQGHSCVFANSILLANYSDGGGRRPDLASECPGH